jgi:hypothetical protein
VGCPASTGEEGEPVTCGGTRSCESEEEFAVYTCYKPEDVVVRERMRRGARAEQGIRMVK